MSVAEEAVKTFATTESSRIKVLNTPLLAPGVCCICGASRSDDRQYIDLGIDVEYVGVMYFCTFCMTELANTLGCLTPEQSTQLQEELDAARQTIIDFQQEKAALDGAVDTLRRTGLFSGTDLSSVIKTSEAELATEPGHVQDIVPAEQGIVGSNKNSKQSNSKPRPNDLPEPGSDELESFL